ncbi:glycoside hydrolase family 16 protein [Chloroflexia bacterium SDU3-3]|nr:glycoside hydrolase family 16 protein [Chloroflexia bacterium SDU3-3]
MAMLLLASASGAPAQAQARTISFGGYEWQVRADTGGPGPNTWSADNVWLDSDGALHLRIDKVNGAWRCAELYTTKRLGFGTYQFQVIGQIDQLDKNVVLGLFNYPTSDVGADTTNEIDIEFARWGNASYPIGNYTVWPQKAGAATAGSTFNFTLNGTYTTHRFTWTSKAVSFASMHGHRDDTQNSFASWTTPSSFAVGQKPMPVHLNLWLFDGKAPSNGQSVEIVIKSFKYTPS